MGGSPDGSSPVGNGGDAAGGGFGAFDPRVGATPRHRAPLSRRSSSSSGWIAFNELGTVDYEDDELASEEMYGTAGEEHGMAGGPPGRAAAVRRALASASGSQLGAMLLLPPLNPPAAGRRGWRRGSGEDGRSVPGLERWGSMGPSRLGAVPEGEEEADSWLQRRCVGCRGDCRGLQVVVHRTPMLTPQLGLQVAGSAPMHVCLRQPYAWLNRVNSACQYRPPTVPEVAKPCGCMAVCTLQALYAVADRLP